MMKNFFITKSKNEDLYGVLIYDSRGFLPNHCETKLTLVEIKTKITDLINEGYNLKVPNGSRSFLKCIDSSYYILNLEEIVEAGILIFALI